MGSQLIKVPVCDCIWVACCAFFLHILVFSRSQFWKFLGVRWCRLSLYSFFPMEHSKTSNVPWEDPIVAMLDSFTLFLALVYQTSSLPLDLLDCFCIIESLRIWWWFLSLFVGNLGELEEWDCPFLYAYIIFYHSELM